MLGALGHQCAEVLKVSSLCTHCVWVCLRLSAFLLPTAAVLLMPAGGSDAARALVGKWLRKPSDGCSKVALFGRVEGVQDSSTVLVRWDDDSSSKPSPVTEAQPVPVAAGWVAGRVSARLKQKFEWYPLAV
jgi:hypothetical protein